MNDLFTMSFAFNREMEILWVSDPLKQKVRSIDTGLSVLELFNFQRPINMDSFEDILEQHQSLFLMNSKDEKMALRGQIVPPTSDKQEWLIFAGSPWMSWMSEHCPEIPLSLSDFPRHDSQMDHNFYVQTQQSMVRELEQMNADMSLATKAAEQAKKSQSDFFAVMSHEMRTPLNGVISALGLIDDTPDETTKEKLLSVAQSSANNLLSVINYVLDYSKIDAGKLAVENTEFDLFSIEESVQDILSARASTKGIALKLEIDDSCPKMVIGDGDKIRQILINLGSNAVKFTDQGEVKIATKLLDKSAEKITIQFDVSDTGIGIPKADQPRIFDAFWTSDNQTSRKRSKHRTWPKHL